MPTPESTQSRHASYITRQVAAFKDNLARIVNRATAGTIANLPVTTVGKLVAPTAQNLKALRGVDKLFMTEMDNAGFDNLLTAFVQSFPGQLPFYQETLSSITDRLKEPLPEIKFSTEVKRFLAGQQVTARTLLRNIVEQAAQNARNRVMFNLGQMPYPDLVKTMAAQFDRTVGQSETLAATSLAAYYRTVNASAYQFIEDDLPEGTVAYYRYVNPVDKLTRPFCKKHANRVYTREQIDELDNGQIPNVFLTAGGYRCRGHWILDHIGTPRRRR